MKNDSKKQLGLYIRESNIKRLAEMSAEMAMNRSFIVNIAIQQFYKYYKRNPHISIGLLDDEDFLNVQ